MAEQLKDRTYIVGRERRQQSRQAERERRSGASARSQRYLAIPHRSVSRRHAELIVLNGTIYLRDLGSKNGTFLLETSDGRKTPLTEGYVQPEQLIMFGDCVRRIGQLIRERQVAENDSDAPAPAQPPRAGR